MADECPKCPPVGAPLWLATFADLMSLLMCFFILLLSMATIDAKKFKKMSDEMQDAFGVQKDVPSYDIPMGTSIIAQHFSPAPTEPTPLEEVKQTTQQRSTTLAETIDENNLDEIEQKLLQKKLEEVKEQAEKIKESLKDEIKQGLVSVEAINLNIIIRIEERGSFPSGTAVLKAGFEPVMKKISAAVNDSPGKVHVAGHSDDIPISTQAYRSNWELSASRAVTVSHFLFQQTGTDPTRFVIEGYADTKPLVPNKTQEDRAKNRRVEIVVMQDDPSLSRELFPQAE
ncbi:MAG: MotB family protein [Methylicorpusculum sp.]|uniref:MotB family protein n=1 Tax=Methylicorpusculum sp. TaxID=2713644 RepID=UPI002717D55C|nr:MotB family protein [Methylicorpusculum sp.]MDO8941430.1 MotB family protein [Methylicorpusculum sp.]MDO9239405.1 MotB family protein [Methylicorpusculum sp.]MDP2178593.1 MotB family protein [Methylicorpusculum sp.]MDP2202994.1 MotB family protein [Methylicorpusculum sp.]MDP3530618.1 MotB family protein [Methylicorpusculum sp.]